MTTDTEGLIERIERLHLHGFLSGEPLTDDQRIAMPDGLKAGHLRALIAAIQQPGERAAIVAWLRSYLFDNADFAQVASDLADAIEQGQHHVEMRHDR